MDLFPSALTSIKKMKRNDVSETKTNIRLKEDDIMSWDNITGDTSILPSSGNGGQDEIKFEAGKLKKLRLLLPNGAEPYSYLEHCLEVESFENGQQVRTFRTIRCPKTSKNPGAVCPLCDGQQVRRRVRHACNVFDYDLGKVQKLNAGEAVFKTIATTRKMGVDILGVDWGIMKSGTDRNDTTYTTTNVGATPFTYNADEHGALFDIEAEYQPVSVEEMRAIVESAGGNWYQLTTAPELKYPTLQEALAHVMPNGKYKGQTFQQIWDADKSPRGYISFLAMKSDRQNDEKAAAQVIYARLGGVHIDGVPMEDGATQSKPAPAPAPANSRETTPAPTPAPNTEVSADRKAKIDEINDIFASNKKFIDGGFNLIVDTLKKYGNGKSNIQDFTDAELDALLAGCKQD